MVNHHVCSVLTCNNTGRNSQCTFYDYPRANWKLDQRNKMIKAVNRKNNDGSPWFPKRFDKICSDHFVGGKKSELPASPSYVPSIFISQHTIATVVPEDPLAVPESVKPETPEHVVPTFSQLPAPKEVPIEPYVPEDDDYLCKDCAADIDGFSWWCVRCPCGALCGACAVRAPHDAHYMLRAPQGATYSQTQRVLAAIRQQLQNENLLPLYVDEFGVKLEVKLEPVDPPSPLPDPALDPKLEPVLDAMLETALDTGPGPVLDLTLDPAPVPAFDPLLDPAMEPDPLTTEPNDAGKEQVAETQEDEALELYLAKRQRYMETIKPYQNKKIPRYGPRSPNGIETTPNRETTALKDNPRGSQTLQTPVFMHLYSSNNLRGSQALQASSEPGGSQNLQTPSNLSGSQALQATSKPGGSQNQQTPSNLRGSQTLQTASNLRGSQTRQSPRNIKRLQTQAPRNLRVSQSQRTASNIKSSETLQTPSNPRVSQTVLKVVPSNLISSQTAKTSPGSSQTVSKPHHLKIKRTLLKVPISELSKPKTLHFSHSAKSIRKVKPSELLKIKKVQNVFKNTAVLTQQNDSKELKLHNVLRGFSTPLKVTSEPPRSIH